MKRTTLILLSTIYLLSCTGMGINSFYCCGKLTSVTLNYGAVDNAGKVDSNKDNCCKTEKQSFKLKDSHFNVASVPLNHPIAGVAPSLTRADNKNITPLLFTNILYKGNAPPGYLAVPVYALNCTYRI